MDNNAIIITSINNVRHLINNSILMLRDLDAALSKHGFQPLNGNALATESSKHIHQSMEQNATFFPQYIARQYALESEIDANQVNKILFTNIQFYHGAYEEITPTMVNSVMIFPNAIENVKNYIQNWWLKYTAFEHTDRKKISKNGELNENIDENGIKTLFWCHNLIDINGQNELLREVDQLVQIFSNN
ncbi:hypothetical protein [Bacillus rhizoplanae]|uniref:hypothetical protein n=1 Tax=Bacillus rhizoplanae TaxID=2880966 RepID=UPI003D2535D0